MVYIITFHGDLDNDPVSFHTLEEALNHLVDFGYGKKETGDWLSGEYYVTPDPEDDRILIWEVNPPFMRVVWHFSGWHWSYDCSDQVGGPLDQGALPGHDRSLYDLAMEGY